FVSMCKSLDRFEGNSSLATWLHRIVVNNCRMRLRSRSRRKSSSIDELESINGAGPWTEIPRDPLADDESQRKVRACIDKLPEEYRTVLVLRHIEEFDTEQTAAVLGLSLGAVKTRLHRARRALRVLLEPYVEEGIGSTVRL